MENLTRDKGISMLVVGCGVALGISGFYSYYKVNKSMKDQIKLLADSIDGLKREVEDLRIASERGSPMISSSFRPLVMSQSTTGLHLLNHESLNCSRSDVGSDNEEYFDFADNGDNNLPYISQNGSVPEGSLVQVLKQLDSLLDDPSMDKQMIYNRVQTAWDQYGDSGEIMIRMAKATHLLATKADKAGDAPEKKRLSFEAVKHAKVAVTKCPQSSEANKWYAITMGSISDYLSTKEKIENGSLFKHHVDIAMKLQPNDPTLHHMLGRFCMEIASLSWIERRLASTLFAEVPEASLEDTLRHLLKAYELKKDWKENLLYLATCSIQLKDYKRASEWISQALDLPILGEDDQIAHQQILLLKSKHSHQLQSVN